MCKNSSRVRSWSGDSIGLCQRLHRGAPIPLAAPWRLSLGLAPVKGSKMVTGCTMPKRSRSFQRWSQRLLARCWESGAEKCKTKETLRVSRGFLNKHSLCYWMTASSALQSMCYAFQLISSEHFMANKCIWFCGKADFNTLKNLAEQDCRALSAEIQNVQKDSFNTSLAK